MTSDVDLLDAIAAGSHEAFEVVFDPHADFVFNIARRRTGSATEAEDITAGVFVELWRKRGAIRTHHGSLRPWLAGTATNLTHRHWRTAERRRRALLRLASREGSTSTDFADSSVAGLDAAVHLIGLRAALLDLPRDQFDVLTLSVWEELTHAEIAEALGIAKGTVKSRLSRARSALTESLRGNPLGADPTGADPTGTDPTGTDPTRSDSKGTAMVVGVMDHRPFNTSGQDQPIQPSRGGH